MKSLLEQNDLLVTTRDSIPLTICTTKEIQDTDICIVCSSNKEVVSVADSVRFFSKIGTIVIEIPELDIKAFEASIPNRVIAAKRARGLAELAKNRQKQTTKRTIIVTTINSILRKVPPISVMQNNSINLKTEDIIDSITVKETLCSTGYVMHDISENIGEFSSRGGVIDVVDTISTGIRLTFDETKIESIKLFDIKSQKSQHILKEVAIYPYSELILNNFTRNLLTDNYSKLNLNTESTIFDLISSGVGLEHYFNYLPLMYESTNTILDYINSDCKLVFTLHNMADILNQIKQIDAEREEIIKFVEKNTILPSDKLYISTEEDFINTVDKRKIFFCTFIQTSLEEEHVKQTDYIT